MKISIFKVVLLISPVLFLSGCMNMSTPVERVMPKMEVDPVHLNYRCEELNSMLAQLKVEERGLAQKQVNRGADSVGHALYYGWGKGDGMDTIELIKVRRSIFSIENALHAKHCD